MKIILSMQDPLISSYPNYGHIFSIIGSKTKDYIPWVYNHFVQLYVPNNFDDGIRIDYATPSILKSIPWIETNQINRKVISSKWNDIVDFLRDYINCNYYVYALYNVGKITAYKSKEFWHHDALIYGYDDDKKIFYFADNFKNGKYSLGIVSYEEIRNANKSFNEHHEVVDWLNGFWAIKYKEIYDYGNYRFRSQYKFVFDKKLYVELIKDYLNERNSFRRWCCPETLVENDDDNN